MEWTADQLLFDCVVEPVVHLAKINISCNLFQDIAIFFL